MVMSREIVLRLKSLIGLIIAPRDLIAWRQSDGVSVFVLYVLVALVDLTRCTVDRVDTVGVEDLFDVDARI